MPKWQLHTHFMIVSAAQAFRRQLGTKNAHFCDFGREMVIFRWKNRYLANVCWTNASNMTDPTPTKASQISCLLTHGRASHRLFQFNFPRNLNFDFWITCISEMGWNRWVPFLEVSWCSRKNIFIYRKYTCQRTRIPKISSFRVCTAEKSMFWCGIVISMLRTTIWAVVTPTNFWSLTQWAGKTDFFLL